jgi:hypothetical protein
VSNGQKKWEEILALGLDETKWREIFKLPFIVNQIWNAFTLLFNKEKS